MNQPTTYTFAEGLVQAIVNTLGAQPASQSRGVLNAIEHECAQQDQARTEAQRAKEREAIETELKAKLQAAVNDKVQTPAPDQPPIAD